MFEILKCHDFPGSYLHLFDIIARLCSSAKNVHLSPGINAFSCFFSL